MDSLRVSWSRLLALFRKRKLDQIVIRLGNEIKRPPDGMSRNELVRFMVENLRVYRT